MPVRPERKLHTTNASPSGGVRSAAVAAVTLILAVAMILGGLTYCGSAKAEKPEPTAAAIGKTELPKAIETLPPANVVTAIPFNELQKTPPVILNGSRHKHRTIRYHNVDFEIHTTQGTFRVHDAKHLEYDAPDQEPDDAPNDNPEDSDR